MDVDDLRRQLTALDTTQLADLLRRRPDAAPPGDEPADLAELAERLLHPFSLAETLRQQPVPVLQLLEAAMSLGGDPSTPALTGLLDGATEADVDGIVHTLRQLAVVGESRDGTLALPDALHQLFPDPLGLGEPLAVLLADLSADDMRRIARAVGLERPRTRHDAEVALAGFFADPTNIADLLADAPQSALDTLTRGRGQDDGYDDEYDYDPDRYVTQLTVYRWAANVGLAINQRYGYGWRVPAEVTRVLRGPDFRARFDPHPPPVPTRPIAHETQTRESAASATEFLALLLSVGDHLARYPVKALKSGGLGARELTKLAKTLGTDEIPLRLALELAAALGLLALGGPDVGVGPSFAAWRENPPEEQFTAAVQAWWDLPFVGTRSRDDDDKPLRALVRQWCGPCQTARHAMIGVLADVGATDSDALGGRVLWQHPGIHLSPGGLLTEHWREARLLGVVADDSVSPLGAALMTDADPAALRRIAETLLPTATHYATFGSDLTVFVAGSPAARVSSVLDSAADREGRGGAVTWRFTPASVRRAFDDGASAETLLADLSAVSQAELPQPLRYLVADVARRHGNLRLSDATSVVRSDDTALLALIAADRSLAKFGPRLLAPTVLAATVPVDSLLAGLRAAGYFPVMDGPRPDASAPRSAQPAEVADRAQIARFARKHGLTTSEVIELRPTQEEPDAVPDWLATATRIAKGRAAATVTTTTEKVLARLNRALSRSELRRLANAVDNRGRIGIDYVATSGNRTRRVIFDAELQGPSLVAWCELRQDERAFTVSRIVSVQAV